MKEKSQRVTKSQLHSIVKDVVSQTMGTQTASRQPQPDYVRDLGLDGPQAKRAFDNEPGFVFGAVVRGLAASGGNAGIARGVADHFGMASSVKALAAGDTTAGGILVQGDLANEVIELLRPMTSVRRIQPRSVKVARGTKEFPKLTSSATAAYVGENEDIASSEPAFGSVVMTAKKLACLVPVSNELISFTDSVDAEREIRDDMIETISQTEDSTLLRSNGTSNKPKGLRYWANASNITATNGTSATNIEDDFKDMLEDLEGNNVKLTRPHWIMASRSKNHLINLRDANGNLIYPEIRNTTPTVHGIPVVVSNNVPTNLGGGGNETEIYLADGNEVYLGEVEGIEVAVSTEASYLVNGSLVSAFSRDQTLLRVILHHDLAVRHDVGIAVKTGVTWGA